MKIYQSFDAHYMFALVTATIDLKSLLQQFTKECEVLHTMTFRH